ncbi:MAG: response regulator [Campylobacterota bacterium]|nr:response regulator [Campylobacterota bacterium]
MQINYGSEISYAKKTLAQSIGNLSEIIITLKELTLADSVDLLFYNEEHKHYYDKIKNNNIPIQFLENDTISMIGKAYLEKRAYRSSHTLYDKYYNISLDNPFKIDISSQLIFPIINQEQVIGMIRFSKNKYMFENHIVDKLTKLEGSFFDIFSSEIYRRVEKPNSKLFSIREEEVNRSLYILKRELDRLSTDTHNPEIKKLLLRAEENIDSVYDYINLVPNDTNILKQEVRSSSDHSSIKVIIADDVHMNVKILNAMIKGDNISEINFAYDGNEALDKIKQVKKDASGINILFLDHYMPGKLGLEVAEEIREDEKKDQNNNTIIISITNDPSAIEAKKGLYDYRISKPFVKSDVTMVMNRIQQSC